MKPMLLLLLLLLLVAVVFFGAIFHLGCVQVGGVQGAGSLLHEISFCLS